MYILFINIHGLVRSNDIEFGRDADTGGQTRYVVDLVKNLSRHPEVSQIDLATRMIRDKRISPDYSRPEEAINDSCKIIRFSCGTGKYLNKEKLWPHLDEFTDRLIAYISEQKRIPDIVYGHYADAGYVASQISSIFAVPFVFAGHSLGKNKLSFFESNGMSREEADKKFAINTRIQNEEEILSSADLVVASTEYEKKNLYGMYNNADTPDYAIIPPGLNLDQFFPYYEYEMPGDNIPEIQKQAHFRMNNELKRFHFNPEKPVILSLCRPDARKNIDLLIDIYGQDKELQAMANLAIFAGIRDDISDMPEGERQVLTDILLAMDKYDLYGKIAIPKNHDPAADVPEMYRIAALKRGVFASASFLETFGLTFVESSAAGLPFIATNQGGPADIVKNCKSGLLVNIGSRNDIVKSIKKVLTDNQLWTSLSENGINNSREIYTWEHHCNELADKFLSLADKSADDMYRIESSFSAAGKRLDSITHLLIADIDDTLTGDDQALGNLKAFLEKNRNWLGFGVATGRNMQSASEVIEKAGIPYIDIIISSVGTEIYYKKTQPDRGWVNHISKHWKPERIRDILSGMPYMEMQKSSSAQRKFKISYNMKTEFNHEQILPLIHDRLMQNKLRYSLIYSHGLFLDILPYRASKGKAIRYLSNKWKIPSSRIITAGNSGNDYDMLSGNLNGIVVSNHEAELDKLKGTANTYFAEKSRAAGILEGLKYFLNKAAVVSGSKGG